MISNMKQDIESRMQKAVDSLATELTKLRTGRANVNLLDHVMVDYYGTLTHLNQVATINAADSRTLLVTPWEKTLLPAIEKAILNSDLGLNPAAVGNAVRVPMPPLNEERRKELIKVARHETEQSRISVRNIRRDANQQLKDMVKSKEISEDDERRTTDYIQKATDKYINEIDKILQSKEKDLMEV